MASMAYFRRICTDEEQVRYVCGPDRDELTMQLTFVQLDSRVAEADLGYTARKAAGQILKLFRERGEWPERGASIS